MSKLSERTTIYLEPQVKKFLQLLALQKSRPMSELINDFFAHHLREFEKQSAKKSSLSDWNFIKKR